jgi:membrane protease YdiL (CAAX protease family)
VTSLEDVRRGYFPPTSQLVEIVGWLSTPDEYRQGVARNERPVETESVGGRRRMAASTPKKRQIIIKFRGEGEPVGENARRSVSALSGLSALPVTNLALALLGLPLFVLGLGVFDADLPQVVSIGVQWALAGVVVGIALRGEGRSLAELGFRRPAWIDIGYVLGTSVVILLVYTLTDPLVTALGLSVREASAAGASVGIGVALAQAVTTGVVEEILYRGYPIERLLAATDSPLVAGTITWGVFTAAHALNWPLGNLLQTALVAAVLTLVYLRRRTLAPVVGAHVLVWVLSVASQFAA